MQFSKLEGYQLSWLCREGGALNGNCATYKCVIIAIASGVAKFWLFLLDSYRFELDSRMSPTEAMYFRRRPRDISADVDL